MEGAWRAAFTGHYWDMLVYTGWDIGESVAILVYTENGLVGGGTAGGGL